MALWIRRAHDGNGKAVQKAPCAWRHRLPHCWGGAVKESRVVNIFADCLMTQEDYCFYDEHGINWMFTRKEAEKMALKSH